MSSAIETMTGGVKKNMSVMYIPRMTLKDRIYGRAVHGANSGPNLCLNNSEEIALTKNSARWIWHKSKGGHTACKVSCKR